MRDVPYIQANTATREIGVRLTFTDPRLRFQYLPTSEAPGDYELSDSSEYSSGLLQVARLKADPAGTLRYRYIANLDAEWPEWSSLTTGLASVYHLALHAGRVFAVAPAGMAYADFDGAAFGAFTQTGAGGNALVAPVSATEVYFLLHTVGTPYSYGKLWRFNLSSLAESTWYGRIYDTVPVKYFDAVRVGPVDYVYMTEEAGRRTAYVRVEGTNWSEKKFVIPLDVVDDVSSFRLSSAAVIHDNVIVTGALSRSWGVPMHIYTVGPGRYTLGRDLFIGSQNSAGQGKLHLIGSNLWYIGPGVRFKAPATVLVGCDNPDKTFTTETAMNLRLSMASNQPYSLSLDLKSDLAHPSIRSGSLVKVETCVNGEYSDVGTYNIDALIHTNQETGPGLSLALRSQHLKSLAAWESDAPYDYWSQTKLSTNPKDLSRVIRTTGLWKDENSALTTYDLNKDGFLYTSAKSCHNGTMRAKFKRLAGDWNTRVGVGVNYYIETKAEAAARLARDTSDVTEADYGQNGIFAIYGNTENNGSPGVGIYALWTSVWTKLASAACIVPDDTDYWIQLRFREGLCQVYTRPDNGAWSKVLEHTFERTDMLPWKVDSMGRGAIFVRNQTAATNCVEINGNYIIVEDATGFPGSDIVMVENEKIGYSGVSNWPTKVGQTSATPYPTSLSYDYVRAGYAGDTRGETFIPVGNVAANTKVRQKLDGIPGNMPVGVYETFDIRICKVGNPNDTLKVTVQSSAGKVKATKIISPFVLSEEYTDLYSYGIHVNNVGFTVSKFTLAATDYLVFERSGANDPNNYYKIDAFVLSTGTLANAYNGSAWSNIPGTGLIFDILGPTLATAHLPNDLSKSANVYSNCFLRQYDLFFDLRKEFRTSADLLTSYFTLIKSSSYNFLTLANTVNGERERVGVVYPSLMISRRGLDGTAVADHKNALMNVYRAGPFIYISSAEYYSSEQDLTLEDMVAEIAAKSGSRKVDSSLIFPATVIPSTSTTCILRQNVIARLRMDDPDGTIVLEGRKPTPDQAGFALTICGSILAVDSEIFTCDGPVTGDVTVSIFEEPISSLAAIGDPRIIEISVWQNGSFLHTFTRTDAGSGEYFTIKGTSTIPLGVHISEACMRVDNFILDNGKNGAALIDELIGEKRFYYQDRVDGIYLFRTRQEVGASSPYRLTVTSNNAESDVNLSTRIRIEGSDIREVFDEEMMIEHGNLFRLVHMNEVNSPADAAYYAGIVIDEMGSRYKNQTLTGAADPRIEPNDVIYVQYPEGVKKVIVDGLDFTISVDDSNAMFDMNISGRVPRSELS